MGQFSESVVLVTGGTSGIGAAIAQAFAREEATVIVAGRHEEPFQALLATLHVQPKRLEFMRADVAREDDVEELFGRIQTRHGHLDCAINSAGIFDRAQSFHEYDENEWESLIAINLSGVFRCMQHELRMMINCGGAIVNIASVVAQRGSLRASPAYVAAKHGVLGLTRQAAIEYASKGIRVNSISPGPTRTPMASVTTPSEISIITDALTKGSENPGLVDPATIAAAALFLCSKAAQEVNGLDLVIDTGQSTRF